MSCVSCGSLFAAGGPTFDCVFASVAEGRRILSTCDDFIEHLTPLDRSLRMKTEAAVSQEEYLRFLEAQVLAWETDELARIRSLCGSIREKLAGLEAHLPRSLTFVKTTGREEGNAFYVRGDSTLVMPEGKLWGPWWRSEEIMIHELFHVICRGNPTLKEKLYAILGFEPIPEIPWPDSLESLRITGPGNWRIRWAATSDFDGSPIRIAPLLLSSTPKYDSNRGGEFFQFVRVRYLVLEPDGYRWQPKTDSGTPVLLDLEQLPSLREKLGRNSGYLISPEEILADSFVLMVNGAKKLPSPRVVEQMRQLLMPEARHGAAGDQTRLKRRLGPVAGEPRHRIDLR
jgi:hypothetical protein